MHTRKGSSWPQLTNRAPKLICGDGARALAPLAARARFEHPLSHRAYEGVIIYELRAGRD